MAAFKAVAAHMRAQGCDGAILGCTEFRSSNATSISARVLQIPWRCFATAPLRRSAKNAHRL